MKIGIKMITEKFDSLQDTDHLLHFNFSDLNLARNVSNLNNMINVYNQIDTTLFCGNSWPHL